MSDFWQKIRNIRPHLGCLALIALYLLILFFPIPFGNSTIVAGDTIQQFLPWVEYWVSEVEQREYPLWNPYTYGGSPFLGNLQIAPYYPTQYILPRISYLRFFAVSFFLHALFSGFAMYALLYWITRCRFSSTFFGLVYASSGFLVTRISDGQITIINALPWIPLALLAYMHWEASPSWKRWSLLTLVLAVQILAGQPQVPYLTCFLLGLLALNGCWHRYRQNRTAALDHLLLPLATLISAGIIAALLTAIYWMPFYEFNQLSAIRSTGTDYAYATKDSMPLSHPITLILPFFYGDPSGQGFWATRTAYLEICGFLGIGVLLLALYGLLHRVTPRRFFWGGSALLCLLLALGSNTPLYLLLYWFLPGVSYFRVPGRFMLFYSVCLCILGASGLKMWLWDRDKNPSLLQKVILCSAALPLFLLLIMPFLAPLIFQSIIPSWVEESLQQNYQSDMRRAIYWGVLFSTLWFAWFLTGKAIIRRNHLYAAMGLLLIVVELGWFSHRFIKPEPVETILPREYSETDTIRFLKENTGLNRIMLTDAAMDWRYRKHHPELFPNRLMIHRLQIVRGCDQTFYKDYATYIYQMQGLEVSDFTNIFLNVYLPERLHPRMLSALNVRYLVTPEPVHRGDFQLVHQGDPNVYEYLGAFPRAYILPPDLLIPERLPDDATATISLYTPNEIRLRALLPQDGWLVVADNFDPQWRADVNGSPAQVEKVLGTFRGIFLPPGEHEVRMYFHPTSFYRGAQISSGTLLLFVGVNLAAWYLRRRQSSTK